MKTNKVFEMYLDWKIAELEARAKYSDYRKEREGTQSWTAERDHDRIEGFKWCYGKTLEEIGTEEERLYDLSKKLWAENKVEEARRIENIEHAIEKAWYEYRNLIRDAQKQEER